MLRAAGRRLLERFRRSAPPSVPPRRWEDELADAGTGAAVWVARRLASDAVYVSVSDEGIARLREAHPDLCRATLDAASRVLIHEFDLLGSGPYTPIDPDRTERANGYRPIDWHLDPVSRLCFPRAVPLGDWNFDRLRPGLADIKLPWELARCQHWPLLGEAYRLTGDDRFAVEIADQLRDFVEANPVGTAVNWACTMDVALRAANWAIGLQLVRACPALTTSFWHDAYRALFDHGAFIEGHLENAYEVTSNHFLSNVVGLFFLAGVFADLPRGRLWNRQCRAWLAEELDIQVLPDGADYESSIPYHRLVTELFLGAARQAHFEGEPFEPKMRERLRAMVALLAAVERPDGLMPQVGDADDGRLHILSGYGTWRPQDARHLYGPAAGLFERDEWVSRGGEWGAWERAWWGLNPPATVPSGSPPVDGVAHFPRAGLTVMRRRQDYLLVTNGIVGTAGFGNHKHNDLLGFEFHANGVPVVVDPGSYVYTSDPAARNLFRATATHNTVSIDGAEQNELRSDWLFRMFETASPEHLDVEDAPDYLRYRGRHRGYARLSAPVVHERTFTLSRQDGSVTIVDALSGEGAHRIRWHFHFAPGIEISAVQDDRLTIKAGALTLHLIAPAALRHTLGSAWYSPSYGVRYPCACLDSEIDDRIGGHREYIWRIAR